QSNTIRYVDSKAVSLARASSSGRTYSPMSAPAWSGLASGPDGPKNFAAASMCAAPSFRSDGMIIPRFIRSIVSLSRHDRVTDVAAAAVKPPAEIARHRAGDPALV